MLGSNNHGKLGLDSVESSRNPILVEDLIGLHIQFVSCGLDHSLAVAHDG